MIWNLFPQGDKVSAKESYTFMTTYEGLTIEGKPVTPEVIYNHFAKYLEWWNSKYKGQDDKFITKSEKLKSFSDFVSTGEYKKSFHISDNPRDSYLFGNYDRDDISKRIKQFKAKFPNGQQQQKEMDKAESNTFIDDPF